MAGLISLQEQIIDLDMFGKEVSAEPVEYVNETAVDNALKFWLSSRRRDYLKTTVGGPLDGITFKDMSDRKIAQIKSRIKDELQANFSPGIDVISITITPDYERRIFRLQLAYNNPATGLQSKVDILLKDFSDRRNEFKTENVPYVGENLETWVDLKKLEIPNNKLTFNEEIGKWVWANYILTNLSTGSANFAVVFEMINGVPY